MSESLTYNPSGKIYEHLYHSPSNGGDNWQYVSDDTDSTMVLQGDSSEYAYDMYSITAQEQQNKLIDDVTVYIRCETDKSYSTYNKCRAAIQTHGNLYAGTEQSLYWEQWYEKVWVDSNHVWAVNPYTGARWTWAEIVSLGIGVGLRTNSNYVKCAKVYAVVHYTVHNVACRAQIIGLW